MGQIFRKDILRLLAYALLLFFVFDFLGGIIINQLYNNAKSGIVLKEKEIFFETDAELLIFGSSRAAFHYVPEVFEKNLSLSSYNAGREGTGIFFEYAALIATLERYKPQQIILDIDFRDVYDRGGDFGEDVFTQISPYYGLVNSEFDHYITRSFYDKIFYKSNLIKFNKKILNIFTSNLNKFDTTTDGFAPLEGQWNGQINIIPDEKFNYSQELVNTIDKFIKKTQQNKIELTLVISPTHKDLPKDFIKIVDSISLINNVRLLNFMHDDAFNNKRYFNDMEHLNYEGALKFSEILSNEL